MDWADDGRVVTLVAFDDGTTSLYFSQGGGILGMGADEAVRGSANAFREQAAQSLESFHAESAFDLPPAGIIVFFIVNDSGTLGSGRIKVEELESGRHALSPLGAKGLRTITAVQSAFKAMQQGGTE